MLGTEILVFEETGRESVTGLTVFKRFLEMCKVSLV